MPFIPDPAPAEATSVEPRIREFVPDDPGSVFVGEPWYVKHLPAMLSISGGIGGGIAGGPPGATVGATGGGVIGEAMRQ